MKRPQEPRPPYSKASQRAAWWAGYEKAESATSSAPNWMDDHRSTEFVSGWKSRVQFNLAKRYWELNHGQES